MSARVRRIVCTLVLALAVAAPGLAAGVGEVAFPNSGEPAAQPAFLRGLALLHNFEYEDAAASFRAAQALAPDFAMAYWGEAMTHTHPIWMQQDLAAARAVLGRLGATPGARLAKAPTERERDYLRTLDVLYGEGSKEQRDLDYTDAMAALRERYPDDVDATAFYALALLGTAHQGRDFATYMRAAALLEEVFPAHPRHPGVLHYMIHSYDDAVHAPLGMRAARLYGDVAPDAGHALHMTSHIFIALGQWEAVVDANARAMAVVDDHRHGAGKTGKSCGHYADWLHYGLLQQGRLSDAERALEQCRQEALSEAREPEGVADPDASSVAAYAEMRLRYVVETGKRPAESVNVPSGRFESSRFNMAYADAYAAARGGEAERAREAVRRLGVAQQEMSSDDEEPPNPVMVAAIGAVRQQVDALLLLSEGKRSEGLELLARAAEAEEAIPLVFGPPAVEKPSRELLGEELLSADRPADAKRALEAALARAPGRTAALRALLRAQTALGERRAAARTQAQIDRNLQRQEPAGAPR